MDNEARADVLLAAVRAAYASGNAVALEHDAQRLLQAAQALGDPLRIAQAHNFLATAVAYRGEGGRALKHFDAALAICEERGDIEGRVRALVGKGMVYCDLLLDLRKAGEALEQALTICEQTGRTELRAFALANRGELYRLENDYAAAIRCAIKSRAIFEGTGDLGHAASQSISIAQSCIALDDDGGALAALTAGHEVLKKRRRHPEIAAFIETGVLLAGRMAEYELAARLDGFLELYRQEQHFERPAYARKAYAGAHALIVKNLPSERLERLRASGRNLSFAQAAELVLTLRRAEK